MSEKAAQYIEQEVTIPQSIYVNCPLHGDRYPLVNVQNHCVSCAHFQGFFKQDYKGREVPFSKEFSVKCGLPVSRQITEVIN